MSDFCMTFKPHGLNPAVLLHNSYNTQLDIMTLAHPPAEPPPS